jgi:hypothetical protein
MANWICTFPSPLPRPLNIRPPRESSRDFTHLLPHHHQEQHGTPSQSHHEHHPGNVESQWTQYGHHVGCAMPNKIQDLHKVDKDSFPYIYEENATVELKTSDGLVRVNVFRPKTDEKVPVLCTYGPYGKDIPYKE